MLSERSVYILYGSIYVKVGAQLTYSDRKWINGSLGLGLRGFTTKGHEETFQGDRDSVF